MSPKTFKSAPGPERDPKSMDEARKLMQQDVKESSNMLQVRELELFNQEIQQKIEDLADQLTEECAKEGFTFKVPWEKSKKSA